MKKWFCALAGGLVIFGINAGPAFGIPAFKKEFEARYVGEDEETPLAEAVDEARCNVCHIGKKKENMNEYGIALSELLDRDEFKKDRMKEDGDAARAEIQAALEEVESLESPTGDTYLERIEAGTLPVELPPEGDDDDDDDDDHDHDHDHDH